MANGRVSESVSQRVMLNGDNVTVTVTVTDRGHSGPPIEIRILEYECHETYLEAALN